MTTGNDDKRDAGDLDDLPPTGDEARAQRKSASMPLIWLAAGLVLIAVFVMMVARGGGLFHAPVGGPAPVRGATAPGA